MIKIRGTITSALSEHKALTTGESEWNTVTIPGKEVLGSVHCVNETERAALKKSTMGHSGITVCYPKDLGDLSTEIKALVASSAMNVWKHEPLPYGATRSFEFVTKLNAQIKELGERRISFSVNSSFGKAPFVIPGLYGYDGVPTAAESLFKSKILEIAREEKDLPNFKHDIHQIDVTYPVKLGKFSKELQALVVSVALRVFGYRHSQCAALGGKEAQEKVSQLIIQLEDQNISFIARRAGKNKDFEIPGLFQYAGQSYPYGYKELRAEMKNKKTS